MPSARWECFLAGTAVYVNAGTQIGRLESISGIVSPQILLSFALLGVFLWLARFALGLVKRRRVYALEEARPI